MQTPQFAPVQLVSGPTVAVRPLLFQDAVALSTDLLMLVEDMTAHVRGDEPRLPTEQVFGMYRRIVQLSLARPEDIELVQLPDLVGLIDAVWDINNMDELIKKQLARELRKRELRANLLDPPTP